MLKIHTHQNLFLVEFNGVLSISEEYCFHLKVYSQCELNLESVLGQELGFSVGSDESPSYFHGEVFKIAQKSSSVLKYYAYNILVKPSLSRLTLVSDCRIYQRLSVVDVIKILLKDHCKHSDFSRLKNTYPKLDFKMQYNQTHYDFLNYLAAEAGIFYYFSFCKDRHVLNFADSMDALPYHSKQEVTSLFAWQYCVSAKPNSISARDFNFLSPEKPINGKATAKEQQKTPFKIKTDLFEYPGGFESALEAEKTCLRKMSAIDFKSQRFICKSHRHEFISGMKFTFNADEYLINKINYRAFDYSFFNLAKEAKSGYYNSIECTLSERPFQKTLKKKKNIGTQSAFVVGAKAQDIYTDKHARIKIQFPWDRLSKKDESSSTWLRVSQWWSDKNFGAQFIPHLGQEVQVDFLNGDRDKPVVTGSLYNSDHKAPFDFANQSYLSAIKTKENALLFSDKKGREKFIIEAKKDYLLSVDRDAQIEVENNDQQNISEGNQEIKVLGNLKITAKESLVYAVGESQLKITGDQIALLSDIVKVNS